MTAELTSTPEGSIAPSGARWLTQSKVGGGNVPPEERGDCVPACIASILGLPLSAVENCHGEGWWDRLRGEVHRHGYEIGVLDMRFDPPSEAYWIATLPSLNLGADPDGKQASHCVVARGYTLIHDPSLGKRYDGDAWASAWNAGVVDEGWVLIPLDPASATTTAHQPSSPDSGPSRPALLNLVEAARQLVYWPADSDGLPEFEALAAALLALGEQRDEHGQKPETAASASVVAQEDQP